jgi:hypothetical protein
MVGMPVGAKSVCRQPEISENSPVDLNLCFLKTIQPAQPPAVMRTQTSVIIKSASSAS